MPLVLSTPFYRKPTWVGKSNGIEQGTTVNVVNPSYVLTQITSNGIEQGTTVNVVNPSYVLTQITSNGIEQGTTVSGL